MHLLLNSAHPFPSWPGLPTPSKLFALVFTLSLHFQKCMHLDGSRIERRKMHILFNKKKVEKKGLKDGCVKKWYFSSRFELYKPNCGNYQAPPD